MLDSYKTRSRNRDIRHSVGQKNVRQAIGNIYSGMEIYGIHSGEFSFINLLEGIILQIGKPVNLDMSSWTVAEFEMSRLDHYLKQDMVIRIRFITDTSFPARQAKKFKLLQEILGVNGIRILRCHCKFAVISNDDWNIAIRTSMNLNENKRIENFEISDDKRLADYMTGIVNGFFSKPFNAKGLRLGIAKQEQRGLEGLLRNIPEFV